MNKITGILWLCILFSSCNNIENNKSRNTTKTQLQAIIDIKYELAKPKKLIKKVVVLFGGFSEKLRDMKREFNIKELAKENNIAVIYLNYNQKLWLTKKEKQYLAAQLQSIFLKNKLPTQDIYIGGFSSGGNISLLLSDFLVENMDYHLKPKGVFIADSPIDLLALYKSSVKNLNRNFSKVSIQESSWIIKTLEKELGNPANDISNYQKYSVYTSATNHIHNLQHLKNLKIRLYTEPDKLWWKKQRMADYNQMNAYYIKKLAENLKKVGFEKLTYISTKNKGYRKNGTRHPHSWSIIDKKELITWIVE